MDRKNTWFRLSLVHQNERSFPFDLQIRGARPERVLKGANAGALPAVRRSKAQEFRHVAALEKFRQQQIDRHLPGPISSTARFRNSDSSGTGRGSSIQSMHSNQACMTVPRVRGINAGVVVREPRPAFRRRRISRRAIAVGTSADTVEFHHVATAARRRRPRRRPSCIGASRTGGIGYAGLRQEAWIPV